ncbi:MAG: metallophosphoesterase family protein [Deltaproteobacteria bacterium]
MRIAALSDVHGNLRALEAVFEDMDRQGAFDLVVAGGDHVLKGPFPSETWDLLQDRADALLEGNTDAYLSGRIDLKALLRPGHWKNDLVDWTRGRLGPQRVNRLRGLAFEVTCEPRKGRKAQFVHANPKNLEDSLDPDAPESALEPLCRGVDADLLVFGHVHIPYVRQLGELTLCDVASAGNPKDGDVRPAWTAITFERDGWKVEQRRVEYDVDAAAKDHVQSGMPAGEKLAQRLKHARYHG